LTEIAQDRISSVRIKVNASRIAAATASAAQSEDRSANQKTTFFFDSIDAKETFSSLLVCGAKWPAGLRGLMAVGNAAPTILRADQTIGKGI
jgi:hypothetical protein